MTLKNGRRRRYISNALGAAVPPWRNAPRFHFAIALRLRMIACAMAELSKTYDPGSVEPKWYQRWIENRDFEADPKSSKPPFSIVIPPPNITGMSCSMSRGPTSCSARSKRHRGSSSSATRNWITPALTQTAVEKHLRRTEKKTRHDLGREEFLRRVLEWQSATAGHHRATQTPGCSCDWSRHATRSTTTMSGLCRKRLSICFARV